MKIVHAFHSYYPRLGGMETAVRGLAEQQAQLGHKVCVITSLTEPRRAMGPEVINNVDVYRVSSMRFRYADLTVPREIPRGLLRDADVVHVHSQNSLFSMKILQEASKAKLKTVCHFMAVDSYREYPNSFIRVFASHYGRKNTTRAISLSRLALVKNGRDAAFLRDKYGVKSYWLPDGLPGYFFTRPTSSKGDFRTRYGIRQEHYFVFIGRQHEFKGPHILVRALKLLGSDTAAVFIGPDNGYMRHTLDEAKRLNLVDRVYVLGVVSENDKIDAIDAAEALVVPSVADHVEAFSIVISEAWARRKPVVASRVGNIPFRVHDGINGLWVEPRNEKSLAKAMSLIMDNPELAKSLGEEGRKQCYTWTEIARASIALYDGAEGVIPNSP